MEFLSNEEKIQLQKLLMSSVVLETADEDYRRALLTNCGLGKYCTLIKLNQPRFQFVTILCQKLSEVYITVDSSQRLGLIVFLEYISQIDFNLSDDDKNFINHVITKWEQWQASSKGRQQPEQRSSFFVQESFTSSQGLAKSETIEVFFSYSHKDEELRDQLVTHLAMLKREEVITDWHDRKIIAGKEFDKNIDAHLNQARLILLLISPDFIASDYCYEIEVKRAMERHKDEEACVVPIILRPCDWKNAPFGKLLALPKDAKPITTWQNRDQAFLDVTEGIRKVVKELAENPHTAH